MSLEVQLAQLACRTRRSAVKLRESTPLCTLARVPKSVPMRMFEAMMI